MTTLRNWTGVTDHSHFADLVRAISVLNAGPTNQQIQRSGTIDGAARSKTARVLPNYLIQF
jgi:hypothetical protein